MAPCNAQGWLVGNPHPIPFNNVCKFIHKWPWGPETAAGGLRVSSYHVYMCTWDEKSAKCVPRRSNSEGDAHGVSPLVPLAIGLDGPNSAVRCNRPLLLDNPICLCIQYLMFGRFVLQPQNFLSSACVLHGAETLKTHPILSGHLYARYGGPSHSLWKCLLVSCHQGHVDLAMEPPAPSFKPRRRPCKLRNPETQKRLRWSWLCDKHHHLRCAVGKAVGRGVPPHPF